MLCNNLCWLHLKDSTQEKIWGTINFPFSKPNTKVIVFIAQKIPSQIEVAPSHKLQYRRRQKEQFFFRKVTFWVLNTEELVFFDGLPYAAFTAYTLTLLTVLDAIMQYLQISHECQQALNLCELKRVTQRSSLARWYFAFSHNSETDQMLALCQGCRRFLTISDPRWDQPISDIFI